MSSRKNPLVVTFQIIVILAMVFGSFAPSANVVAQNPQPVTDAAANDDISQGITIGKNSNVPVANVPVLAEEIVKQAQNDKKDETLRIKLSAEPAIYIPGKPIVITWKIVGGNANKTSGLQIIARPSDGVIPADAKIIPATDGSAIISPTQDAGVIAWKVLDYAVFPLSFNFDVIEDGKIINTNLVYISQPLVTTSTTQTAKMQKSDQGGKNKTQVTIPSNAASAAMVMDVHYPSPNALNSSPLSWNPVEVIAVDKSTAKNITKFKNPITIQITYDESKLFSSTEEDLSIYYYDPDLLDWFPMETEVDTVNNTLTVKSDHLTVFDYKANNWQSQMLPTVDAFKTSDFTGAATYQINMWTPPAPGGLQPDLTLSYNSQIIDESLVYQQASWAGMGWDLDTGAVTLNMHGTDDDFSDDTFNISIAGSTMQLMPTGENGTNITYYNTADESFMRVESHDYNISDPDSYSFIAWTKDGTRYDFKTTLNVRKTGNNCNSLTWRWSLTKVTDIHGNVLNYDYDTEKKACYDAANNITYYSDIAVYPKTITYGNGKYQVNFIKEARADYQTSWSTTASNTIYGTSRLKEVKIQQNTGGSSWIDIKKYVLSYAPNDATNIFPNYTYSAGGKTLTLVGIQEFGADAATLPAVTFSYADSVHLTAVNNGQGGSVTMAYSPWSYNDDTNLDVFSYSTNFTSSDIANNPDTCYYVPAGSMPQGWTTAGLTKCDGTHYMQIGKASGSEVGVANRLIPQTLIKPSGQYRFTVNAMKINTTGTATISWGFENPTTLVSAVVSNGSSGTEQVRYLALPATSTAATNLRFSCYGCFLVKFALNLMPTYYRVTSRTVTVQPTGVVSTYTYTYDYDNASPATVDNSAAVASGGALYTKKLREFRGNAMSQMTNTEKLTTVNWFWQADGMKGRAYDTFVLQRDFFDALESLGAGWTTTNGTPIAEYQKDFDNSIKSVNGTLTRTASIGTGKVAVAHIRLSGAGATGSVGLGSTVITLTNGSASVGGTPLLSGGNFKLDEWYAVMIFTDTTNGNRVRIWQLDDPNNFGEAVVAGSTGAFSSGVTNGTIYTDSYFEGTPYSETITRYGSSVLYSASNLVRQGLRVFVDLGVVWVFPNSVENRTYNGDAKFVGTKQDFTYATAAQFGNLLTTVESGNSGGGWSVYRKTNYEYYPIFTPILTPTKYLISFPARQTVTDASNGLLAETLYFYDGNTAYTASPSKGDLTMQRVWAGGTDYAQSSMTYDSFGNVLTQSGYTEFGTAASNPSASSKQTTTTVYDSAGYNTYPVSVTNQLGQSVSTAYNYTLGLPISVTDANSVVTSATYDGFGRMKTITAPGDSAPTLQVNYFDASIPVKVDLIQTVSASSTIRLSRFYDGAGRQIQTQTASAVVNGALNNIAVDYQYNAAGRLVEQTVPYTIASNITPAFNAQAFTQPYSTTSYDVVGRTLTTVAPNQTSVTYSYSDLSTTVTDPKLNATTTSMDVWGRTTLVHAPTGPDVTYSYDVLNRLTDATRAGANTHINYDVLGRKLNMSDPDMGYWSYTYDALGNLKSQIDTKNQLTCLYYDALNRLDGKIYSSSGSCGTPVSLNVDYTYDAGTNGIGRRTSIADASGSTAWTYDTRGRLSTETKVISGQSFVSAWTYNPGDLPFSMTYPDGETLTYGYNSDSTLKTVTSSTGGTYLNDMQYDEAGRLKLMQYGTNIINKTFNYFAWNTADMGGLLSSVSAASLQSLAYTYDKNGNVLTIADALAGPQTQTFTYDALNRIKTAGATGGANGLYSESYDYDAASGNLSLKNGNTYQYNSPAHIHAATTLSNGNSYVYDANGNMTQRNIGAQTFDLVYDAENRMVSVNGNSVPPATATPANTLTPTASATATKTSTPTNTNTPTKTNTPLPATATKTATPTRTNTPLPVTATNTSSPTYTATRTNTPLPGTATNTPTLTATQAGCANTYTSQPDGANGVDMYISSGSPTSAHETTTAFSIGEDNTAVNYYRRTLIKFDLSSIPSNAVICSATLSLTVNASSEASNDRTVRVYRMKTAWSEQTGTWNAASTGVNWQTAGASGVNDRESTDVGSTLVTAGAAVGSVQQWGLNPAKIQEMVAGTFSNNGFLLQPDTEVDDLHDYYSSDYTTVTKRPKLVVQYTIPSGTSTPTATPTLTQTPAGNTSTPTNTSTKTNTPVPATATNTPTVTMTTPTATQAACATTYTNQPDAANGVDMYMSSGSYSSAHETSTTLLIGEDNTAVNYYRRSAIKFDLSSIPSNAVICSASLSLTVSSSSNASNDRTVRVYRVKTAWSEQTGTWNSASTGVSWQTAGASGVNDRESTDIGSSLVTAGAVDGFVQQWNLDPAKVQEMVAGSFTNNGFVLQPDTEVDDLHEYYSSDYSIATQRPKLVIQYTIPIAAVPAAKVVFAPIAYLPPLQSGPIFSNAAFTYNGDGQRVKSVMQTNIATSTTYFVGNYYEVTDPSTGSGQVVTKYYYAGSQRIAMRKNGTLNYLLSDHLGSTSIVTDASGNMVNQTQYKAWGEERYSSGTKQTGYGYTGQYSDSYINLLDYGSRRYDPELGRFIQPDSIVPVASQGVQAWDRYAYGLNNPSRYTDPTGHMALDGDDGNYTKADAEYNKQRLDALKCQSGNDTYCSYGELHPVETAISIGVGLAAPGIVEYAVLEGGAAAAVDTALYKAGLTCIRSMICKWVTGMVGGSGADSGQGFSSFRALKKFLGDPGDGKEWHHIVEQNQILKSGFPKEQIQNTNNIIAVDEATHDLISAVYNSNVFGPGSGRVRDWLVGQSFEAQYDYGLQVLRNLGVIP